MRDTLSIVALVGSMLYLDWALSLIVLGVYPIAALPVAVLSNRLRKVASPRTQNEIGGMTSLLAEKLSSARLIKTFRLGAMPPIGSTAASSRSIRCASRR